MDVMEIQDCVATLLVLHSKFAMFATLTYVRVRLRANWRLLSLKLEKDINLLIYIR